MYIFKNKKKNTLSQHVYFQTCRLSVVTIYNLGEKHGIKVKQTKQYPFNESNDFSL